MTEMNDARPPAPGRNRAPVSALTAAGLVRSSQRQVGDADAPSVKSTGIGAGRREERPGPSLRTRMPIEVERKFPVREDTESRLREMDGQCQGTTSFLDRYYDTPDYQLTTSDHWLRSREGHWQLKSPLCAGQPSCNATRYQETDTEAQILPLLLPLVPQTRGRGLAQLVEGEDPVLRVFASIHTERTTYCFPGGLRVDLDQAGFGYQLGEIEVVVGGQEDIPSALAQIEELAQRLGLGEADTVPGKMHVFLQKFLPLLFQKLLEARIL